jgi:hypothetical protein
LQPYRLNINIKGKAMSNLDQLNAYLKNKNGWRKLLAKPELNLDSDADRVQLASMLDSDLSPENLHCDGEISRHEAARREAHFTAAAKALVSLDPAVRSEFHEVSI